MGWLRLEKLNTNRGEFVRIRLKLTVRLQADGSVAQVEHHLEALQKVSADNAVKSSIGKVARLRGHNDSARIVAQK